MLENIKEEVNSFIKDIDKIVKDPDERNSMKQRSIDFVNIFLDEIENIMTFKEERVNKLIKKQEENEKKLTELQEKYETMYQDIYDDGNDMDFAIICPYCNYEFDAEIDEQFNEIKCPECGNTIELDWNGNPDDDSDNGCRGGCSGCHGCH